MTQAKKGSTVKIHYTGTFEDGTVFDSSADREPLQFTLGEGKLIPGFENAVEGMSVGETKTEKIAAEDAYGPRIEELVLEVPKDQVPPNINAEVGAQLQIRQEDGRTTMVQVTNVTDTTVTLDANHPLAGKDLIFKIDLVEVA